MFTLRFPASQITKVPVFFLALGTGPCNNSPQTALGRGNLGAHLSMNSNPPQVKPQVVGTIGRGSETSSYRALVRDGAVSLSSLPRKARGKSIALNSAPTRMTSEIRYIHTSSAMPTPREP